MGRKVLIIMPRWSEKSLWGVMGIKFPYLSLTTLAALTPPDLEVRIMDENVEPIDFDSRPDLVAVSLMTPLAPRGYEIADQFRSRGIPVVVGGVHATMVPEEAEEHADAVVIGEGEILWPEVVADFVKGKLKKYYLTDRTAPFGFSVLAAPGFAEAGGLPLPEHPADHQGLSQ